MAEEKPAVPDTPNPEEAAESQEAPIPVKPTEEPTEKPPTPATEQKNQTEPSASEKTKEESKPTSEETQKPSSISKRKFTPRSASSSTSGSRRMAYIILIETIVIIGMMVLNVLLIIKVDGFKKEVNKRTEELNQTTQAVSHLEVNLAQVRIEKQDTEQELKTLNAIWQKQAEELEETKTERARYLEEKLRLGQELTELETTHEKTTKELSSKKEEVNRLQVNLTQMTKSKNALSQDYQGLEEKFNIMNEDYQKLVAEKQQREKAIQAKRKQIETLYVHYQPEAIKVLNVLIPIRQKLEAGVTLDEFNQIVQQLMLSFEEFKITIDPATNELLSFKLLNGVYTAYQNSLERWKALTKLSFPKEIGNFREKTLTSERPIISNRPWLDTIQILWQKADWYTDIARQVLDAKEFLDPTQCTVCKREHVIHCPKCNASGICSFCAGKGHESIKGEPSCGVCEGSGKCPLCQGRKIIPCPICKLYFSMTTSGK